MAALNGFVKLHRKMIEWGWYSDHVVKDVFIHLLMVANWKDSEYLGYKLKPGDAIVGRKKLSQELGFSERQIRTALSKLESTGEITLKTTNRFTIATVENWTFYQDDVESDVQQATNERPTDVQQATNERPTDVQQATNERPTDVQQATNERPHLKKDKNNKKDKKDKKDKNIYSDLPPELEPAFMEWAEMRERIKKPITTAETVKRALSKLDRLADTTGEKIAILNQSTDNCWQGLFALKESTEEKRQHASPGNFTSWDNL